MKRFLLSMIAMMVLAPAMPGAINAEPVSDPKGPKGAEREGGEFRNIYPVKEKKFSDLLKWRWERRKLDIPPPESYSFEAASNDPAFLRANRELNTFTWIGHATALVQINGVNILTDPHFSLRSAPVQWAGPKRAMPPGIALDELPEIDIVLLSHDHYDSLDISSISALARRPGGQRTLFAVPLKYKKWFEKRGALNVVEFDWWQSHESGNAEITAVPAQHWSKRYPLSRNRTLWAGWVVEVDEFKFYFVGDSGYAPIFKDIEKRFGPMDLSAIPIGAYEPRWFMKEMHMNPEEAVMTHKDVRSRQSIAVHWGTFVLTDEPLDEPPVRLREALRNEGISESDFMVLKHGETVLIDPKGKIVQKY